MRRANRWRRRLVLACCLVVLAWVAGSAALVAAAALDADDAKEELEAARARYSPDELVEGEGLAAIERAQARFASAERRSGSLPLAPVTVLPVVGRQLRSLNALAGAGADVLAVALDAAGDIAELRDGELEARERVAAVEELHATVTDAARRLRAVSLGPDEALVTPLADARRTVAEELDEALVSVERAEVVTAAVADVLDGARYVVLAANNAEMQAGWGMPLSVGLLEVVDGELALGGMQPASELVLPVGAVRETGDLADNWAFMRASQDFRNLALTASFDQAAPVAAAMWEALGRGPVDGVLVLDPLALRAILTTTGPVQVAGGVVTAEDVVPLVLHDAYVAQGDDFSGLDERREQQSEIAGAVVAAATGPGTDLVDLARNLADAARNRHVMLWSSDPVQQAAWVAAGVDGGLQEDSLLVGAVNRAANKVDWFMDAAASIEASAAASGGTDVTVEIGLANSTPEGEPYYIAGPAVDETAPRLAAGDWWGFLTVHLPGDATDVRFDGLDLIVDGRSGPTRVVSAVTLVPRGETRSHVLRFALPAGTTTVTVEPSARARPVLWTAGGEQWADDSGPHEVVLPG